MKGMNIGALALMPSRRSWITWPISCTNSSTTKPTANVQPKNSAVGGDRDERGARGRQQLDLRQQQDDALDRGEELRDQRDDRARARCRSRSRSPRFSLAVAADGRRGRLGRTAVRRPRRTGAAGSVHRGAAARTALRSGAGRRSTSVWSSSTYTIVRTRSAPKRLRGSKASAAGASWSRASLSFPGGCGIAPAGSCIAAGPWLGSHPDAEPSRKERGQRGVRPRHPNRDRPSGRAPGRVPQAARDRVAFVRSGRRRARLGSSKHPRGRQASTWSARGDGGESRSRAAS